MWLALSTRLRENYARMRDNGVTIDTSPAPAVIAALQSGAAAAQQAWCARSKPTCEQVLGAADSREIEAMVDSLDRQEDMGVLSELLASGSERRMTA